jgi:hypothetical protein
MIQGVPTTIPGVRTTIPAVPTSSVGAGGFVRAEESEVGNR